jgi:hypothetical protein
MPRHPKRRVARCAVSIIAVVLFAAAPAFADDGLQVEGDTTYDMAPAQGRTTVSSTIVVTNVTTDHVVGAVLRREYFNGFSVAVPVGARNISATSSGANMSVSTTIVSDLFQRADISFPALFAGQRRTITFGYEIVGDAPRAKSVNRANAAYESVVAVAYGDDTLAKVRVNVPPGFDVETVGSTVGKSKRSDGGTTLVSSESKSTWGVIVSARNDNALQSIDADVGTRDVVVRAWPNDVEWQNFVVTGVGQGLPVLESLIGLPWPIKSQLQITEATSSYLRGYAGWFSTLDNTIEVGEALDYETLLHELSHAWFNRGLFVDRWINEGFAEEYAGQALKALGKPADDVKLDTNSQYAVRLTDWGDPQVATGDAAGREEYGYHTAAWLVRQLTDEIGLPNMAKVVRAVEDNTPAYGNTPNEFGEVHTNSTRLLDLLENVGGSKNASDLFEKYVSREADASSYDTRAASRAAYQQLVDRGGSWTAPAVVRKELGSWDFASADLRMTEALSVLGKRDQLQGLSAKARATAPNTLEAEYEKADTDLSKAIDTADRQLDAATTLAQTSDRVDGSRSITEKVGLLFAHPGRRLDQARQAFADDDTARSTDVSLAVQRELDHASTVGLHRVAVAVAVLLLIVLVALTLRGVQRRRRATAPPPPTCFPPPPSPPPPPPPPPSWFPVN